MPTPITPSLLFKTAAVLNALTIPGHFLFGRTTVYPGLNTINTSNRQGLVTKASALACFNYLHGSLLVAGT
jgi:hypothetical protein